MRAGEAGAGPGGARPGAGRRVGSVRLLRDGLLAAVCVVAAACATLGVGQTGPEARFHRLWEAGRYGEALALYEQRDSTLHRDGRVLWRTALARLQPAGDEDGPRDPAGAARALEQLLEREPEGARAVEARTLLETLSRLDQVRTQLERLKAIDLGQPPELPDTTGGRR